MNKEIKCDKCKGTGKIKRTTPKRLEYFPNLNDVVDRINWILAEIELLEEEP